MRRSNAPLLVAGILFALPPISVAAAKMEKPLHDPESLVPEYHDVIGEYIQIPGAQTPGTPAGLDTAAFLRLRLMADGENPQPANAVIVAMPGFSSVPSHWLYLGAQLVHKASQRSCAAEGSGDSHCRVEVWIVNRRGANLEDTSGLRQARSKRDPNFALDYYFGRSILSADPKRPGKFPLGAPDKLVGRPDAKWRPLEQGDATFMADWGFETYAADVEKMIALVKETSGSKNVFLAGHSQGGGFLSSFGGLRLPSGQRGYETLAGLIFLDGGPSAGTAPGPSPEQLAKYFEDIKSLRAGKTPVFTTTNGLLGAAAGPAAYALNSVVSIYYALTDPNSESTIFPPRAVGAMPSSPAGDAFLLALRLTYRARAGMSFDVDPIPGIAAFPMQSQILTRLGEGLGKLDFTPVAGTAGRCDPLKPDAPCPPSADQVDRTKVYNWIEGGGNGTVPKVGKAQLWLNSLAYAPARTNIKPLTVSFSTSGKKSIDASNLTAYNWYASSRYDSDMQFLGQFRTVKVDEQGAHLDIDKAAIAVPVYVAHQTTNKEANNPFPLVKDFTEINKTGAYQSEEAAAIAKIDPAINVSLYHHTDFVSADDSLAGQVAPGQPGASAVADTLIDWVLMRSKGRAAVPTPKSLGVTTRSY